MQSEPHTLAKGEVSDVEIDVGFMVVQGRNSGGSYWVSRMFKVLSLNEMGGPCETLERGVL